MKSDTLKRTLIDIIEMVLGSACSAFAVACFALPYDMIVSGVSGIGRVFNKYLGWDLSTAVLVINIVLFMTGFIMLGKKFAAKTLLGTICFPVFLRIFTGAAALQHLVNDPLLAAIAAGLLDGLGLNLVFRSGGSSGGVDVPPIILNRKLGWKVAPMMYVTDLIVFLVQLPFSTTNAVILGLLYALVYTLVLDKLTVMDQGGIQFMIFSNNKIDEINEKLLSLDFGTTILHGESGYLHDDKKIIYCVASNRYASLVRRAVLDIDSKAFVSSSAVNEINGNGFTLLSHETYNPDFDEREDEVNARLKMIEERKKEKKGIFK